MGEKNKNINESIGRGICLREGLGHRKVWRHLCRKVDFLWVAPEYTFMGLHEGGSGWVAVFGGRVWLVEFWGLWKVLAESCMSHWKLEGS